MTDREVGLLLFVVGGFLFAVYLLWLADQEPDRRPQRRLASPAEYSLVPIEHPVCEVIADDEPLTVLPPDGPVSIYTVREASIIDVLARHPETIAHNMDYSLAQMQAILPSGPADQPLTPFGEAVVEYASLSWYGAENPMTNPYDHWEDFLE